MNAKTILFAAVSAAALSGCMTPPPAGPPITPLQIAFDLPLEPAPDRLPFEGGACLLSTARSCVAMDPRPFGPCLVATKSCDQQGAKPERIAPAIYVDPYTVQSR